MRTLILGLDAATWRIMSPLLLQGLLPNIQRLIDAGVSGVLRSTTPPMTPPAWTSIVTGVNPGKHGIFDFVQQDRETYRVTAVDYEQMTRPALWDIFNSFGKKVGVINFPLAFPPPEVDSFFISGIPSPEEGHITHPIQLKDVLEEKGYKIYPRDWKNAGPQRFLSALKELTDTQVEVFLHLIKRNDLDLVLFVLMGLDWVQHYFWDETIHEGNIIHACYQFMDDKLGQILSELEDEWNILVISDHGAREIHGEIHLNRLLEEWGYLKRSEIRRKTAKEFKISSLKMIARLGSILPYPIVKHLKKRLPGGIHTGILRLRNEYLDLDEMIDWSRTRAFSFGYMGHIYIHSQKKYPSGVITEREYEDLQTEIIEHLTSLKNPSTGESMIGEIFKKNDIYSGKWTDNAPDILFNPVDFKYMVYGDFGSEWFHPPRDRAADHDTEGVFIIKGKDVQEGIKIHAEVTDIAPILLYMHDLPVLEDMDGHLLKEMFHKAIAEKRIIKKTKSITRKRSKKGRDEEKEGFTQKLKDLGYL